MKQSNRLRHACMILALYGVGIAETYYLPRYGIEWFLGAMAVTVFLGSSWIRSNWD